MKRFALIAGSTVLLALAACNSNQKAAAPGAVGSKSACCKEKAACADKAACTDKAAAGCPMTGAAAKDAPAAAAPGAVSDAKPSCCKDKAAAAAPGAVSDVKSGCDGNLKPGCSKSGSTAGCPMSGAAPKSNG